MAEIFISYSRRDSEFARWLSNELHRHSRDVWIDWKDIPRGADWLNEIYASIETADTFVLIVSQHSLTSEICNYEIAHAQRFNKRIVPLIRQPVEGNVEKNVKGTWVGEPWEQIARENWETIRHINWLDFHNDETFQSEFDVLLKTLDQDLPHRKAHTHYLVQALEWERAARNPSFLLMGDEIEAAEAWLKAGESKQPPPDPLQREHIGESRRSDDERKAQAAEIEQRIAKLGRRTRQFSLALLALVVMVALALIAIVIAIARGNDAREQVVVAERELATATVVQLRAATAEQAVVNAGETLAPIPATLNAAGVQIAQVSTQVATARTQSAVIGASLTPVPPTLTAVAHQIEASNRQRDLWIVVSQALVALSGGETDEASQIASNLALTYADEANAYLGSGAIYAALDEYDAAFTSYSRAIELDPQLALAYYNRGVLYGNLGEYERAIEDYTRAIELDPQFADAYVNRSVFYAATGNYEQAIEDSNRAIALSPDDGIAYLNRGRWYYLRGNYQQALNNWQMAEDRLGALPQDTQRIREQLLAEPTPTKDTR